MILEGKAGVGKTFLLDKVLEDLPNCTPLITAPTNEAVRQIEKVTGDTYTLKTVYSALGFRFDTSGSVEKLKWEGVPTDMDDYSLLVIDECSMVGEVLWEAIENARIRVLFIGHRAQLPEVKKNLSVFDKCESLVFTKGFRDYILTQPVRHTGKLYEFCNHLEELIYSKRRIIKSDYNMSLAEVDDYFENSAGDDFRTEHTKMVCFTNKAVDRMNNVIRELIFKRSDLPDFVVSDKLILTKPALFVGRIDFANETKLRKVQNKAMKISTNSTMEVLEVNYCDVLTVPCVRLTGVVKDERVELFVPTDLDALAELKHSLEVKAFSMKSRPATVKAFRFLHYVMRLFSSVKHSYALTAYRSQGMTIPRVIVRWDDMKRCNNVYLKHKLLYVAASRAGKELGIVR